MLNPRHLTRTVSPTARKALGLICMAMSAFLIFTAWRAFDPLLLVLASFVGVPFTVIGVSLIARPVRRGYGLLSPLTLYAAGAVMLFASIAGMLDGEPRSAGGIALAIACFFLANKRKAQRSRWWTSDD